MSRRSRRNQSGHKRGKQQRLFRQSRGFPLKSTILIVGEGRETEPNYFRGVRAEQDVRDRYSIEVKKGIGFSACATVKLAIDHMKRKETYDEVCCVVDVEGSSHQKDLKDARALAKKHGIRVFLSNPCFEVWVLAHFKRTSKYFADADAACAAMKPHWKKHCRQDYVKSDDRIFERLRHLTDTAIDNARNVREKDHRKCPVSDANSSTEVDILVSHLLGRS